MQRVIHLRRVLVGLSAAALALALAASAFAQAPPSPPHQFFGSTETGSGVTMDGAAAADGTTVVAVNADTGEVVGSDAIDGGTWLIQVDLGAASSVTFSVEGFTSSAPQAVDESGGLTEVALALTAVDAEPPPADMASRRLRRADGMEDATPPATLPNTGTGGLAGSGSGAPLLPLALIAAVVVALGGVTLTRRAQR